MAPVWLLVRVRTRAGGHVCVVRATALLLSPTMLAIQQEYMVGGTLEAYVLRSGERLAEGGPARRLDQATAVYFMRQLLQALAFVHSRRIVFRDVKPSNCMLDAREPPRLALCDFGVARAFKKKTSRLSMHTVVGTPGFISPGVMGQLFERGGGGYDGRAADVWSAGAVLCQLLTGRLPFGFDDAYSASWDLRVAMHRTWAAAKAAPFHHHTSREVREQLSPAAVEALDVMMAVNEGERPTAEACLQLPLMRMRLPEDLETAVEELQQEQKAREAAWSDAPRARMGTGKTAPGGWKDSELRAFVARAAKLGSQGDVVATFSLLAEEESVVQRRRNSEKLTPVAEGSCSPSRAPADAPAPADASPSTTAAPMTRGL